LPVQLPYADASLPPGNLDNPASCLDICHGKVPFS
jgi:hypothetical protein